MAGRLGLVLPGGGARGAYQVGALKAIAELVPGDHNPFPVITGASVGAITAALLAANAERFSEGVGKLVKFWSDLHCHDIYRTDFTSISLRGAHWVVSLTPVTVLGLPNPRSFLDNRPLHALLKDRIDFSHIEPAIESGVLRAVSVTASSYNRSQAVTFYHGASDIKEWRRSRREGQAAKLTIEHIMASAALPFIFPAQKIGSEHYGDGSLRLTSPLSPAIHTGADRILMISSRDARSDDGPSANASAYPSLGAIGGTMLDIIFMDNMDADIERAKRINHTLSLISPQQQSETRLRNIDIITLQPSQDLREIARQHADAMPWTVRMLMRRMGLWGYDWRLPSYLMFEPEYCCALIKLGYTDTMERADEVKAFLNAPA
ncbi:MAG: patatin-like phospholipase family protein [Pseudomonadota bacterium]